MGATEQAFPSAVVGIGGASVITSPFQFVADADTFLRVVSICSVAGVVLAVQGRRLDDSGQLQPIQETHAPLATRTVKVQDYGLGSGAVLNLTVFASSGAPLIGQCYVMVHLLRNFGGTAIVLGTLLGGYVTSIQALGFPGSPIQSSTEGEPVIRNITGTVPAAGSEFAESCPTGARWEMVTVFSVFVPTAAAGSRFPSMIIRYGGLSGFIGDPFVAVPPSNTVNVSWAQNHSQAAALAQNVVNMAMPQRQFLRGGDTFGSFTPGLQAGDTWLGLEYQVREWLEAA